MNKCGHIEGSSNYEVINLIDKLEDIPKRYFQHGEPYLTMIFNYTPNDAFR